MVLLLLFMLIDVTFRWVYTPKSDIYIHANHISISFIFGVQGIFIWGFIKECLPIWSATADACVVLQIHLMNRKLYLYFEFTQSIKSF